jgi:hypothetical protein
MADDEYRRLRCGPLRLAGARRCETCEGRIESRGVVARYCGRACKASAEKPRVRGPCTIEGCGKRAKAQGRCQRHRMPRLDRKPCIGCGAGFHPSNVLAQYCSKRCQQAAWTRENGDRHKEHRRTWEWRKPLLRPPFSCYYAWRCSACAGAQGGVRRPPAHSRCDPCARASAKEKATQWHAERARVVRRSVDPVQCLDCSALFSPLYGSKLKRTNPLCGPCAVARAKAQKRIARCRRKAMEHTRTVENVDPIKVLERDGWCCYLCGSETPRTLRGTYDDGAPEVDHVIALAAGGEHSYANSRCACRRCNLRKRDLPLSAITGGTLRFASA